LETSFFDATPSTPATSIQNQKPSCFPPWEGTFPKV
jgi:hypothetical protein